MAGMACTAGHILWNIKYPMALVMLVAVAQATWNYLRATCCPGLPALDKSNIAYNCFRRAPGCCPGCCGGWLVLYPAACPRLAAGACSRRALPPLAGRPGGASGPRRLRCPAALPAG